MTTLDDAMRRVKEANFSGEMVQFELSAGVHVITEPMLFDDSVLASEVSIVGVEGAVISLPSAAGNRRRMSTYNGTIQAALILSNYNQKVQVQGVVFQGSASSKGTAAVLVESGELIMNNCTVRDVQGTRALHANGGHSTIRSSRFEANLGGAIAATSGRLFIYDSALVENEAEYGGALAVKGNQTEVTAVATRIERNSATVQGGGLHVADGSVTLANRTVLEENSAPEGAAMQLSGGITVFALPAPRGRWVNTAVMHPRLETLVSTLELGAQDEDYPFACPPGVHGDDKDIKTQVSPVCVGACPAGSICPSATHTPQRIYLTRGSNRLYTTYPFSLVPLYTLLTYPTLPRVAACTEGTYCPRGSAAGTFCPPGTFTKGTNLTSAPTPRPQAQRTPRQSPAHASPTRLACASRTPRRTSRASVRRSRPTDRGVLCVAGPIRSARAAPLDTIAWAARRTHAASRRTARILRRPCRRPACSALTIL